MYAWEILDDIKAKQADIKDLQEQLKSTIQNQDYRASYRWSLFVESGSGDHHSCVSRFGPMNEDYFEHIEKYRVVDMVEEVELALEEESLTVEQIEEVQEAVMQQYIRSFTYDW